LLEQSFERMRQAAAKASDDDLDRPAKIPNVNGSLRAALFQAAGHLHEHLGQLIAYARVGGVRVRDMKVADQAALSSQ
jgi:hypothetical protein